MFVHVSAFPRGQRPVSGCEVTYAELRDERNRAHASEVRYLAALPASRASLFLTLLVGRVVLDELPVMLLASYGLISGQVRARRDSNP